MADTAHDVPADAATPDREIVLAVDLDGTLLRTDTLHEALLGLAASDPAALRHLPAWLREGRAGLKARLADRGVLDPELLPFNEEVVAVIEAARAEGRRTALVSAADHRQVTAVAEATGLFDEAYGSAEGRNLKGADKAAFLTERYGEKGFDYLGDSSADLPVWAAARQGWSVGADTRLRQAADRDAPGTRHIAPPEGRTRAILKAMRPHQWSKNALLFLPMLAAHELGAIGQVLLGFVAFCMTASAVYVLNDLIDLPSDRAHPRKRLRPFASGALTPATGIVLAGGLLLTAAVLALLTGNLAFLTVLVVYLVATFAYSLSLKRKLLVDVLTLAGLYTIRVVAGGAAVSVPLSPWLLGFSGFLFLGLAAVKRQAELTDQMRTGRASSGRAYEVDDLPVLRGIAISAAQATVLVLALYIASPDVQVLYPRPWLLWAICPFLLYWTLRMVMKTHRGEMTDDPIVFAAKDRISLGVVAICAGLAIGAAI